MIAENVCRWYLGLGRVDHAARKPYISQSDPLRPLLTQFPDLLDSIRGKRVIDFGSADGLQSFALADAGASEVLGVEINHARTLKAIGNIGTRQNVSFASHLSAPDDGRFDIAISLNSFEHFYNAGAILTQIKDALRPGGLLFISFGPLWYSAYGPHQGEFTKSPWPHLFFPEHLVMKIRGEMLDQPDRKTYADRGLNCMSVAKYEKIIARSGFKVKSQRYICSWGLGILRRVPWIRELAINRVAVVLEKPPEVERFVAVPIVKQGQPTS